MNILLVIGLIIFAGIITWVYTLFIINSTKKSAQVQVREEPRVENALERCYQLYDEGLHSELQRFAQRELSKNYGDIELRRILAQSLMESGNDEMAVMHYEAILAISPNDIQTQELLAKYYFDNGPKSRAIELYEQILFYDSANIQAVEALSKLYEDMQNYPKAIEMTKMLIESEIDEEKILVLRYALADLYIKVNDNENAYNEYDYIHKANPENLEITMILADLAFKNKYWKDCLKFYQEIITTAGNDYEILQKIAQIYSFLEKWDEAVETYKKIIDLEGLDSPGYLYHQNELCNCLIKNCRYDEAINTLKDLIVANPQETSFLFTLAQAYSAVGQYQAGIELYNKLLDALPNEQSKIINRYISNLTAAWAQNLYDEGDYNHAFDKFFEALKFDEENDDVYYKLGKCNYYIKSFQDAVSHFKHAITLKPQNSQYYFALGCAYDEMGSNKNARTSFYDAINIEPTNIKARIAYAISLTKELEYAKAIEQFSEILKFIPTNADTLYNLALYYELVGDYERAIRFYKEAIDNDPEHKEAKHNIQLLTGETYESAKAIVNSENKQDEETPDIFENTPEIQNKEPAQAPIAKENGSDIDIEDFQQYM